MPFRLTLRFRGQEVSRDDATDDEVTAIFNCRLFQAEVLPAVKQMKQFRRLTEGDFERRIDRIDAQLKLGPPITNGKAHV